MAATFVAGLGVLAAPPAWGSPATVAAPLALTPCRLPGVVHEARCGRLVRPLDPARPDGPTISLRVAVLPAVARRAKPDAVLFLAGGPGQSAVALAGPLSRLTARLGNRRDLVLVDQRGTGDSAPLTCAAPAPTAPLADSVDPSRALERLATCRDRLQGLPHGDLRRYGTPVAVEDLEAVRRSLAIERWNVVGVSYGTRVALEMLRRHPQSVRRAVLDAVLAPDARLPSALARDGGSALDGLLEACAADARCAAAFPDLRARWRTMVASLPTPVTVDHPFSGRPETLTLTPDAVEALPLGALYRPALAAALPQALDAAAGGRFGPLFGLAAAASGRADGPDAIAEGLHFSVVCSEDMPPPGPEDAAARSATAGATPPTAASAAADPAATEPVRVDASRPAEDAFERRSRAACRDWPRATPDPALHAPPPRTPIAALLLSGGDDPVTPPGPASRVAAALGPTARHVVVPHAGHGVLGLGCAPDLLFRFVDAADDADALAIDATCLADVPRPPVRLAWPVPPSGAR